MKSAAVDYAKELVQIPSVSGNELACLTHIEQWMQIQDLQEIVRTDNYVAGYRKGKCSDNALILTGQIDTVSAGEIKAWRTDSWQPATKGDKLYGLGSSDMKGGIAAQMAALEAVKVPIADTWLVVVANEEVDGSGTAAFCKYFARTYAYQSSSAIIAEPTGLSRIEIGHRGNAFVRLSFTGQAGHGSQQASFGRSALGGAAKFLADVDSIAAALAVKHADATLGKPSIVATSVQAGSPASPNKTADNATVIVDIRTTPSLDKALSSSLDSLGEEYSFTWQNVADPVISCLCPATAPILGRMQSITGNVPVAVSLGATDQGFWQAIGVDTIVFGPGEFEQAHAQNEWVSCKKLQQATRYYEQLLRS